MYNSISQERCSKNKCEETIALCQFFKKLKFCLLSTPFLLPSLRSGNRYSELSTLLHSQLNRFYSPVSITIPIYSVRVKINWRHWSKEPRSGGNISDTHCLVWDTQVQKQSARQKNKRIPYTLFAKDFSVKSLWSSKSGNQHLKSTLITLRIFCNIFPMFLNIFQGSKPQQQGKVNSSRVQAAPLELWNYTEILL